MPKPLTWVHIGCGLLFVALVPFQFVTSIRDRRPQVHRWIGRILITDGIIATATALGMTFRNPIGGLSEGGRQLHIWCAVRVLTAARAVVHPSPQHDSPSRMDDSRYRHRTGHRNGAAHYGCVFRNQPSHSSHASRFLRNSLWLGFTINLLAAEAWLIHTRNSRARLSDAARIRDDVSQSSIKCFLLSVPSVYSVVNRASAVVFF